MCNLKNKFMKNFFKWKTYPWWDKAPKALLIMKTIIVLLWLGTLQVYSTGYAQGVKLTMDLKDVSVDQVIKEIKKQSEFDFVFDYDLINQLEKVSINVRKASVNEVLDICLDGTSIGYLIENKVIMLLPQDPGEVENIVSGIVTDKDNLPMPGVNIAIKGTTDGTITNLNGEYNIKAGEDDILVFSFVGYVTQEHPINGRTIIDVVLDEALTHVGEVIVTGIVDRKASTFTGAVSSFKGEELKSISNTNVIESLKILAPSLLKVDNMELGSNPNQNPEMLLRGTSSFDLITEATAIKGTYGSNPNSPLFILDGFETNIEKVIDLDIDRVESITVLKDASAKAIYGSKAANGVIVIETKSSAKNGVLVTYNGGLSVEVPDLSSYNLMNAAEKLQFEVDYGLYEGTVYSEDAGTLEQELYQQRYRAVIEGVNTDWLALPLRNGIGTKHRLNFQVGTKNLRLISGFTYNNIQGAMKGSVPNNIFRGYFNCL